MMSLEPVRRSLLPTRTLWALILVGLAAYIGAVFGSAQISLTGLTVTWLSLLTLGIATAIAVVMPLAAVPTQRIGGRALAAQRRYRLLAVGAASSVFGAVALGTLVTAADALWDCLTLPICVSMTDAAMLNNIHRGTAGIATVLVVWLAIQTWRTRPEPILRATAAWGLGFMLAQNIVGLLQVFAAAADFEAPIAAVRLAHLAVGALCWAALAATAALAYRLPYPSEQRTASDAPSTAALGMTDRALLDKTPSLLKDYISLTKPGVITLLIFTTITSMYITPNGTPDLMLVLWTSIGGWLMASGSHSLNCYFDKDVDINMGRTARRPIPSGRIPAWHALVLGIVLGVIAFAILVIQVNMLAALLSLAGLLYYVFIYTLWLKRTSWNNIVIGGGAGAFPPLVGWAAMTGSVSWGALLLWLIIFYWTPPHFWALAIIRAKDYARAGVPMLPVVAGEKETRRQILLYSIQMLVLTLLPTAVGMLGLPYFIIAVVLGSIFLFYAIKMQKDYATNVTWGLYKYSLLYLALLFAAMVLDRVMVAG
jgi:protoheme IX farnesyltransferase